MQTCCVTLRYVAEGVMDSRPDNIKVGGWSGEQYDEPRGEGGGIEERDVETPRARRQSTKL